MFVWARIPEPYRAMGSLEFSKKLLTDAKVAVSPGIGFGSFGDEYVRFSLIENEYRTRQAIRSIREMFRNDKVVSEHYWKRLRHADAMNPSKSACWASAPSVGGTVTVLRRNRQEITAPRRS